jgi:hypothetical protein
MKKVRSDARWHELTADQKSKLEAWLFEDGMGFEEAWRRAGEELGFKGSVSSVKRFFSRRSQERVLEKLVETQADAEAIVGSPASAQLFRSASMKLVGQLLLQQVRETPGAVKEWSALAKLLLWSEDMESRRQLKREENEIRRENLAFAKERFHFNVIRQAEKALPQLQELAEARKDPKLKEYEENKRINAIIRELFGSHMPKPHPENADEEAAMEEEARKKQAGEASQAARVRQESMARRQAEALRQQEELEEEEPMVEISREELARMAQPRPVIERVEEPVKKRAEESNSQSASRPVMPRPEPAQEKRSQEPAKARPTCLTYQEWAKQQEAKRK